MKRFSHSAVVQKALEIACETLSEAGEYEEVEPGDIEDTLMKTAVTRLENEHLRKQALKKLSPQEQEVLGLKT